MMNTKTTTVRAVYADKQCETMGRQTEADAKYRVRAWVSAEWRVESPSSKTSGSAG